MARPTRIDVEGAIHHVMNRGANRRPVFVDHIDRIDFGRRLDFIYEKFAVETLAYCLMGNHYHLLLRTPSAGLSAAMQHLGSVYTRHVNDRHGRDGPLFRGRFHSILVTTDVYLLWVTRYIHRNPLDLARVRSPTEYRWSSYPAYVELRPTPRFLRPDIVMSSFDSVADFATFTEGPEPVAARFELDTPDDLAQLVQFAIANDDLHLASDHDDRAANWRIRAVLTLLAHLEASPADQPIDRCRAHARALLAFPSETARRMALSRARRRHDDDPTVERAVSFVLDAIGVVARAA